MELRTLLRFTRRAPESRHADSHGESRDADKSRDDIRAWQELFCRSGDGDTNDHERIHHSKHHRNRRRGGAAEAAGRAQFAAEPEMGFTFQTRGDARATADGWTLS